MITLPRLLRDELYSDEEMMRKYGSSMLFVVVGKVKLTLS